MTTGESLWTLIQVLCGLYVISLIAMLLWDICKTVWYQFRGENYEWITISSVKGIKFWWGGAILIAAVVVGVWGMLPTEWFAEADFRAENELSEYTAYYECAYILDGPENRLRGDGFLEIEKKNNTLCAKILYTNNGTVILDLWMEDYEEEWSSVNGDIRDGWYAEIEIGSLVEGLTGATLKQEPYMYYAEMCEFCGKSVDPALIYASYWGEDACINCIYKWHMEFSEHGVYKCGLCQGIYDGSTEEYTPCPWCG